MAATILQGSFTQSPDAPQPPPLTPAREEQRRRITLEVQARREAEAAALPVQRRHGVIAEGKRRAAHLEACQAADRGVLGARIARGAPDISYTSEETLTANQASLEYREATLAAQAGLPEAETTHRRAIERHTATVKERDQGCYPISVEIAEGHNRKFTALLNAALQEQAKSLSIANALSERGNRGDNVALSTANHILESVKAAQRAAGVAPDLDYGRHALEQLAIDPSYGLGLALAPPEPEAA